MQNPKPLTKKDLHAVMMDGALATSNPYKAKVGKSFTNLLSAKAFTDWLIQLLKGSAFQISVAENTTPGIGETLKIRNAYGELEDRFFFPGPKMKKYEGIGFGKPQLKKMMEALSDEPGAGPRLTRMRQGKKDYWYCADIPLLAKYLTEKYKK